MGPRRDETQIQHMSDTKKLQYSSVQSSRILYLYRNTSIQCETIGEKTVNIFEYSFLCHSTEL